MNNSADLAAEFDRLGPWIFQFRIGERDYGGRISAVGDGRLDQFWQFVPEAATILELGALEGAHSFLLAKHPGVKRIVSVEGRAANLRKARFVQQLLGIRNIEFLEANLEHADLAGLGTFDAVFCCGLLYHLPEPWQLLKKLAGVAPSLFIWTQYAAEQDAHDVPGGLRGKIHGEGGPDEPLSGLSPTATWLTLDSLRAVLTASGYNEITVIHDDPGHPNGPAVSIGARKIAA